MAESVDSGRSYDCFSFWTFLSHFFTDPRHKKERKELPRGKFPMMLLVHCTQPTLFGWAWTTYSHPLHLGFHMHPGAIKRHRRGDWPPHFIFGSRACGPELCFLNYRRWKAIFSPNPSWTGMQSGSPWLTLSSYHMQFMLLSWLCSLSPDHLSHKRSYSLFIPQANNQPSVLSPCCLGERRQLTPSPPRLPYLWNGHRNNPS